MPPTEEVTEAMPVNHGTASAVSFKEAMKMSKEELMEVKKRSTKKLTESMKISTEELMEAMMSK